MKNRLYKSDINHIVRLFLIIFLIVFMSPNSDVDSEEAVVKGDYQKPGANQQEGDSPLSQSY